MVTVSKLIVIEVGEGNFDRGFAVVLRIGETGKTHRVEFRGYFPPAPEILQLYDRWQTAYYRWGENHRWWRILRLDFPSQTTNVSDWDDCSHAAEELKIGLHNWLDRPQMRDLREQILEEVGEDEPARLILQTQDSDLRKLPWHLWQLLDSRTQLEITISAQHAQTFKRLQNPVRILAILGSSKGIDIQTDRAMLESLPNAAVKFLVEPSRQELSDRLFERSWDILFFAGHSRSEGNGETGYLWINETDCLPPKELKYAIGRAVQNGLQLAIFNSCDGLGLARELADLHIPHLIVMREPVPDPVAQAFLKYFLKTFSEGESFYLSVRKAREQLHSFEKNYPCASWLPVICQNPAAPELKYPRWNWHKPAKLTVQVAIALGVIAIGAWVGQQENQRFKLRIELEQQGVTALQKFESQQLEALVEAMEAGQGLKKLVKNERRLEKYPTVSPILALQTILDRIYERNQLPEHQPLFRNASLSPDGTRIVTEFWSDKNFKIKVWDISGQLLVELKQNQKFLSHPRFSSDGTRIVTSSNDGTAQVWDISGELITELKGDQKFARIPDFSSDGTRLLLNPYDGKSFIEVWDISGILLAKLEANSWIISPSFSPDGTRIITTAGEGKIAKVWDIYGKLMAEMQHKSKLEIASFSPDNTRIITASQDGKVKVWDTFGKLLTELKAGKENSSDIRTAANFSPDGTRIVTASENSTVKLWDTSGKLIEEYPVFATNASFSPDGKEIVTFSNIDELVRIWNIEGLKAIGRQFANPRATLSGHQSIVRRVDFNSDGKLLFVFGEAGKDSKIEVWDFSDILFYQGKLLTTIKANTYDASLKLNKNYLVTISPSGKSEDEVVKIWDFSDIKFDSINLWKKNKSLDKFSDVVNSPNGKYILTVSRFSSWSDRHNSGTDVSLWDLSGKLIAELQDHQISDSNYLSFAPLFSPDGKYIMLETEKDKTIRIWNLSGELIAKIQGERAVFSPDSKHIITMFEDREIATKKNKTIRIWNLAGDLIAKIQGERAVFSPDSKHIITMFEDREIAKVWDLSGRLTTELKGYQSLILNADFSPDGQRIITAHADNTGRVWDLSGKVIMEIKKFTSHSFKDWYKKEWRPPVGEYLLSFSPDGRHIFTESNDNTFRLWDLSGKLLTEKKYLEKITNAVFSPDGERILIRFYNGGFYNNTGIAQVWDSSGKLLVELKGSQGNIVKARFSPDGQRIITAYDDNTVRIWDLSGRLLAERQMADIGYTYNNRLKRDFFSQDGKQIVVTVFDEGTIHTWRVDRLDELLVRGCNWLKDYLATHPEARSKLKICQQK